jgi:ribonuclease-3
MILITRDIIERLVGTKINTLDHYVTAFTHKSALKQYPNLTRNYENLEFMGDSVLGFIITKYLYDTYCNEEEEGFLTKARTKFVRGSTLATISERLGLFDLIIMDDKGIKKGWNKNPKIMEDVLEALIGAIYIDLGILHTKQFIFRLLNTFPVDMHDDNYKDLLMRLCQHRRIQLPDYHIENQTNGLFHVTVVIQGVRYGAGYGPSKKQAEQMAALKTLELITTNESQGTSSH